MNAWRILLVACTDSERTTGWKLVVACPSDGSDVRRQRQLAVDDNSEITCGFRYDDAPVVHHVEISIVEVYRPSHIYFTARLSALCARESPASRRLCPKTANRRLRELS